MFFKNSNKRRQRKVMRRIKKKKETNKCSKSVNILKVGHHKYTVKKNQSVNNYSTGCNQRKLRRTILVSIQKDEKKDRGFSVHSKNGDNAELSLFLQIQVNNVVTVRFCHGTKSKTFSSAENDTLNVQSNVRHEQVVKADIASSHSDDVKLDPRRDHQNDVTTDNVDGTVELRDAEDAGPNNKQSPQNSQSYDVIETQEESACSPPSGIQTAVPKHLQYATETARKASYSGWPDTSSHTPQALADAGFFYAGFGDCVRCFFCGIGLRHWSGDDDPWIEHARWSRNCVFVKEKKGEEFVNLVQICLQNTQDNEAKPGDHVEGKVKLGDTEMEPAPFEALLDDDTEKDSSLDQPTVCLENPGTGESMEQLKIIEEDVENPVIETIENIQSNWKELTENSNTNMCTEAKNPSNLNELETSLKVSPGLKVITPQEKTWLNLNNLGCFFRKQLDSFFEHFLKYQKYVFNPVHLRPEKPVLCVCPYRYNGEVLAIPWCMMYEVYRLLSLRNANIESENPITIRLASDGFFSDNSGIVSCVFCGSIICDNLFLSQSHEELTTFLDSHCIQCMQRRNNIPLDNYGSHFNLADLMASSDMKLIYLVPSGSSHPAHGARYTCPMARWIHDHFQEIVHSGIRLPQAASAGLPQPDPTPAVIVQQGPIPSDRQSVTSGNIPAVSPSTVEQAVVPASRTIASAVIPKSYVSPPPQSCHMSQQQMEEISGHMAEGESQQQMEEINGHMAEGESQQQMEEINGHMAEGESQQQMEEINEEQPLNGLGIGTWAGEEIIRGELPSNSDAHVGVEDNTRVDVERQLPEPRVEGNFDFAEKTGTNRAEEDNQIINDLCRDHGTGAEATARIRVPEMSDFDARMASFIPCRHQFNQTPQAFTIAGLFYTGDRDQVRCFMCGGCLDQWEEMDNPFLEHVRHYPQCEFIWNFVIDLQMHNDPLLPHVIDAFVMSSAGSAAAADGYTHQQIYNAVDRLIVNRDIITYENIIGMLRDMGESPRH